MSITPTVGKAAANRSGRWFSTAPISRPPFERPSMARCCAARDPLGDQIFAGGDEIVERMLLFGAAAGIVPGLAIFAAAAQVRDREHAAHVDPGHPFRLVAGQFGGVEAAIAVEQGRLRRAQVQAAAVDEEHRHAGAARGGVEDLADFVVGRIEGEARLGEDAALAGRAVVAIDGARRIEAGDSCRRSRCDDWSPWKPPVLPIPGSRMVPARRPFRSKVRTSLFASTR